MNEIKHGGPAFPIPLAEGQAYQGHAPCDGMTLRDYFAAKAMQAVPMPQRDLHDIPQAYDRIATHAYKLADAMLRARGEA